jgi:hypothetical protein
MERLHLIRIASKMKKISGIILWNLCNQESEKRFFKASPESILTGTLMYVYSWKT